MNNNKASKQETNGNTEEKRAILRELYPGHVFTKFGEGKKTLKSLATQAYQLNSENGKEANKWYHKRLILWKREGEIEIYRLDIIVYTYDDHKEGLDRNWKQHLYDHEAA